jgi:HAD superfamily phosphoserine phosphatase-like hydrolase
MKFIFDLDGTITRQETLPLIARHFGMSDRIDKLTAETIKGNIPFVESFIRRVGILGQESVAGISSLLETIPLFDQVVDFIARHSADCVIATGNLDVWIAALAKRIPCNTLCSQARVKDDKVAKLQTILRKESVVQELQAAGETVVFIGDGNNDAEAMRLADYSIASGLIHWPARSVMDVCDFAVFSETSLVRLLEQMARPLTNDNRSTLVLSCAGVGSRLGLNSTKALINFEGKPHIAWQIESFAEIDDLRVVVGFQAADVIEAALKSRNDIIFALNHEYFNTGTGYSLYLGSRFAHSYVIAWDGDLVVHKDYLAVCLRDEGEYLAYSDAVTDDAVRVILDADAKHVTGFSRKLKEGFEWSGPARIRTDRLGAGKGHVFEALLNSLPLPGKYIRAFDIDTPNDYAYAVEHYRSYNRGE